MVRETYTKSYAVYNIDEEVRRNSSSGGLFYLFAKRIIEEGGIVYGASFDNEWQVVHKGCSKVDALSDLMRSKYVQSHIGNVYSEIEMNLVSGRSVLFCGTPCQVKGLLCYLKQSLENINVLDRLITIDFICHGVPSRLVWRNYIKNLNKRGKIVGINFRNKLYNRETSFSLKIDYSDGSTYSKSKNEDPYLLGFLNNLYLRPSCHRCLFKGIDRESDITIADFWGVEKVCPELNDESGISIMMIHSSKGTKLFELEKEHTVFRQVLNEDVIKCNGAVICSETAHKNRDLFFRKKHYKNRIYFNIINDLQTSYIKRTFIWNIMRKIKHKLIK